MLHRKQILVRHNSCLYITESIVCLAGCVKLSHRHMSQQGCTPTPTWCFVGVGRTNMHNITVCLLIRFHLCDACLTRRHMLSALGTSCTESSLQRADTRAASCRTSRLSSNLSVGGFWTATQCRPYCYMQYVPTLHMCVDVHLLGHTRAMWCLPLFTPSRPSELFFPTVPALLTFVRLFSGHNYHHRSLTAAGLVPEFEYNAFKQTIQTGLGAEEGYGAAYVI